MSRVVILAVLLALAPTASARAGWFAADAVDGANPDIVSLGDLDIARDGTGGLVYVKRVDGIAHVFLSRLAGGAWSAPERVDSGIDAEATSAVVAAGESGRLAILWTAGGRLYGTASNTAPQLLFDGEAASPHVDLGINGTAYGVFTAGGADVRAVRLFQDRWEAVPSVLDIDPARVAGAGTGRPRVAVSAEGNAVAVWGETGADGRRRLFGRRITGLALSVAPQEVSVPEFEGAAGGDAELADLDIEDDGSFAWAAFRQDFGATSRALARRLVGSQWEAPVAVDGGGPAGTPRVAMSGRGVGVAAVANAASGAVQGSLLEFDAFGQSYRVDSAGSVGVPAVAASERDEQAVAWLSPSADGSTAAVARHRPARSALAAEAVLSNPVFGGVDPVAGLEMSEDRLGDMAVAFVQAGGAGRSLMVATWDRPPGRPLGLTSTRFQRGDRAQLRWRTGAELWGEQIFRVVIDDVEVGRTTADRIDVPDTLRDGLHRWYVVAVDRRGQETAMRAPRNVRLDFRPPRLRVSVGGSRRRGSPVRVRVRARDPRGGSGLAFVRIDWGDGTRFTGTSAVHRYRRAGPVTITVRAVDRARNATRRRIALRIR